MELEYITDWLNRLGANSPPVDLIDQVIADTNEVNAITGRSEIGKTNLSLHIAYSLSTGTDFLGFSVNKVTVAYIGFEGDEHQIRQRILKISNQFPDPCGYLWLNPVCPIFKLEKGKTADFRRLINGFKVIVIDSVRYIVPGDYMEPKVVTKFMEVLQEEMKLNSSLAVVVFYHKKMDSRLFLEPGDLWNIKGATEWGDMCSSVVMMERTRQKSIGGRGQGFQPVSKDNVTLYFAKTRNAREVLNPIDLRFNRNKCLFERI